MDNDTKMILGLGILVLVLAAALFILNKPTQNTYDATQPFQKLTVSSGSNKLFGTGPIIIVEFTDYLCPFCKMFAKEIEPLIKERYSSKVTYYIRYFPVHGDAAVVLANGALCAKEQEAFSEFHTLLFERASQVSSDPEWIKKLAREIGLYSDLFDSCIDLKKYYPTIDSDLKDAISYGITGTPSIIVIINKDLIEREEVARMATELNLKLYEDDRTYIFFITGFRNIETFDRLLKNL